MLSRMTECARGWWIREGLIGSGERDGRKKFWRGIKECLCQKRRMMRRNTGNWAVDNFTGYRFGRASSFFHITSDLFYLHNESFRHISLYYLWWEQFLYESMGRNLLNDNSSFSQRHIHSPPLLFSRMVNPHWERHFKRDWLCESECVLSTA